MTKYGAGGRKIGKNFRVEQLKQRQITARRLIVWNRAAAAACMQSMLLSERNEEYPVTNRGAGCCGAKSSLLRNFIILKRSNVPWRFYFSSLHFHVNL